LFTHMAWICMAGWALSTIGTPAYFSNVGTGTIGSNTVGHALTAVLALLLGWWGGAAWGAYGVSAGYIAGVAAGGLYVQVVFLRRLRLASATLLPAESRRLLVLSLLAMALCLVADGMMSSSPLFREQGMPAQLLRIGTLVMAFSIVVGASIWSHP